jgi:PAS domain S-box-containing protein
MELDIDQAQPKYHRQHAEQEMTDAKAPKSNAVFKTLVEFGQSLDQAVSIEEVSGLTSDHLVKVVGCDLAVLLPIEDGELRPQGNLQPSESPPEPELKNLMLGESIGKDVIGHGRSFFYSSEETNQSGLPSGCQETSLQSIAGILLSSDGRDLGVLIAAWLEMGGLDSWRPYLEVASELVSAALNKAHLKTELESRLAELGKSEERFRTAFMISPDAVNLTRLKDGALLEVNQAFLDLSGFSRDEVLGRSTFDLDLWLDPKDRDLMTLALTQDGRVENLTIQFKLKNGRIATGILSAKLIELDGEMYVLGFTRDITAQLEAERALKRSEENFRQLAESVGEVVWLRTAEDPPKYLYISPAFEEVWGISRKIIYNNGREMLKTILPEDREGVALAMKRNQRTPEGHHHEFRIKRPDGTIRWIWARRFPVADSRGEVYRWAGLAQDVTEKRLAAQALVESEGKLAAVINSVDEIMMMLDDSLRIVWSNDVARRTFGRELECTKCYEICMDQDQPCRPCIALQTLADGEPHEMETETLSAEGSLIKLWGKATAVGHNPGDQPKSVVVVYRDVTQKKALEAEAMRAGRLAYIGELAAGVAHEINNPINGIINCAEMLSQANGGKLSPDELASRIISEGERVATIVRSLLSFAHEGGEVMGPVSLPSILENCLTLIKAQFRKDGISLTLDLPDKLPMVWGNNHQLQQVALNLMANARYALNQKHRGGHPEKQLAISASHEPKTEGGLVRLVFRDNGTGLPPGIINKVFDPFFTTKPPGMGTGLGLSISHGIVTSHGGEIRLESQPGEYTEAVVELPAHQRS